MASVTMRAFFFAFILFFASFYLPIEGRNLVKDDDMKTTYQGEVEAITETPRLRLMGSNSSAKNFSSFMGQQPGIKTHYASWDTVKGEWHGATAKINLWDIPNVQSQSHSSGYFNAFNYEGATKDAIAAGVHVYPSLYGDNDLHFFTYWTKDDGDSTGCYNTKCSGFVIADGANLKPGNRLGPPSTYGGEGRYITLRIKKDEQTGDWSLYRVDQGGPIGGGVLLGWWPKTLFSGLANFATKIQFIGGVSYHDNETSPPMGSGHSPDEGEGKAAYMKLLVAYDNSGNDYELKNGDVTSFEDADDCYEVSEWMESKDDGHYFYYGGPSGCKS